MSATVALPRARAAARWRVALRARPTLSVEALALCAALFFSVFGNAVFWREVVATGDLHGAAGMLSLACLFVLVTALHAFALLLLLNRVTARPLLTVLLLVSAAAAYFMQRYMLYLDADMVRNVLHTDSREASELLTPGLLLPLLVAGVLPSIAVWRLRLLHRAWRRALVVRMGWLLLAAVVAAGSALLSFQDLSALMRTHRDLRHLITPGNVLVSLAVVAGADGRARGPLQPVGTDARVAAQPAGAKPRVLLLVVGETQRAAGWGLDGGARQTTPQLARIDPVNFRDVTACGSSTEVSLPCMFSAVGRRDYDKARIRGAESLLHVLDHAGIAVEWRDNQSGCKGVCAGLPVLSYQSGKGDAACSGNSCPDTVMLDDLRARIDAAPRDLVVVLHQLGNHGPGYFRRYPREQARFLPDCRSDDLGDCSREQVVNAYDNATLATDDLLARAIRLLAGVDSHDAALLYISDHGESLGENGLYLHGLPYAIAPAEQTRVPMVAWLSPGYAATAGIDGACLRRRAALPASHDHLFHSVLGLLQVRTRDYAAGYDVFAGCTRGASTGSTTAGATDTTSTKDATHAR